MAVRFHGDLRQDESQRQRTVPRTFANGEKENDDAWAGRQKEQVATAERETEREVLTNVMGSGSLDSTWSLVMELFLMC